jgi:hypothetical protein
MGDSAYSKRQINGNSFVVVQSILREMVLQGLQQTTFLKYLVGPIGIRDQMNIM